MKLDWIYKVARSFEAPLDDYVLWLTNERAAAHKWHLYIKNTGAWEDILKQMWTNADDIADIQEILKDLDLGKYATVEWCNDTFQLKGNYITKAQGDTYWQPIGDYVVSSTLANYYTKTECDNKFVTLSTITNYYTKTECDGAISSYCDGQGYCTKNDFKDWLEKVTVFPTDAVTGSVYEYIGTDDSYDYGHIYQKIVYYTDDYKWYIPTCSDQDGDTLATLGLVDNYITAINAVMGTTYSTTDYTIGDTIDDVVTNYSDVMSEKLTLVKNWLQTNDNSAYQSMEYIGVFDDTTQKYTEEQGVEHTKWEDVYDFSHIEGYLPLSGGTMTGDIQYNTDNMNVHIGNPESMNDNWGISSGNMGLFLDYATGNHNEQSIMIGSDTELVIVSSNDNGERDVYLRHGELATPATYAHIKLYDVNNAAVISVKIGSSEIVFTAASITKLAALLK